MNDTKLNVHSIFASVDGEVNGYMGAGQRTVFIRLQGCNLQCDYCDTIYAQKPDQEGQLGMMSVDQILDRVRDFGGNKITLTGGEPLFQLPRVAELLQELVHRRYDVTIETNGSVSIRSYGINFLPRVRTAEHGSVRFVLDYKLPSSGMQDSMLWKTNVHALTEHDVVKFVVSDTQDYEEAVDFLSGHLYCQAKFVFSPAIHLDQKDPMSWPRELAENLIQGDCRFRDVLSRIQYSLQIHKVVWPNATATNER